MTTFQKVVKYLAIAFAVFLTVTIIGGILSAIGAFGVFFNDAVVTEDIKTYSLSAEIRDIDIEIGAGSVFVKEGEAFSVESNLKNLNVGEKNGRLTIKDTTKIKLSANSSSYKNAVLTIYVPSGTVFRNVNLDTGAGKLTIDSLSAETIDFDLGAGDVSINTLIVTRSADIDGGAGRITVSGGALNDLDMDMGVGELDLTSEFSGDCKLDMGVGESNITLIGNREDYKLDLEKGIGSISVDGDNISDVGNVGNGKNTVEINGGVGAINVRFEKKAD